MPPYSSLYLTIVFVLLACGQPKQDSAAPSPTLPGVTFEDIAVSSGLDFQHVNGKSGRYYFIETVASGGGFIDYDTDGDLDVYLLNGSSIPGFEPESPLSSALYRNDGNYHFTDVTTDAGVGNEGNYGLGLATGDYDNDGDDDLFVTNFGANVLYRNDGSGRFVNVTDAARLSVPYTPYFSTSAAFFDYDRDGNLDLYVCGYVDFTFDTNRRCVRDDIQSYCDPDVYDGVPDLLYRNNGDGTFTNVSQDAGVATSLGKGLGVVCGDYDGDGWLDVFVANDRVPDFLYRNNHD
ncbi:MAG: VCBS repeat-containing protein, partial [Gemmatimonadota bacterium]|nr:VCBS repeat-containing protein [Gemmatimonadota bacterium]